ncbi:ThiF family adenylyltransferase [Lentzea sp. NPDC058450]|uniref:ThiF family adenylyltransferase n=1 Tax=Lentzea sp. NPDC058450 TaxID=3346505 RepID=UPI0036509E32
MSTSPLVRDTDLGRLLDDGYDVVVQEGHLIVRQIPYVTTEATVAQGFLTYPVTVAGDRVVSGTDHRIWFGGSTPCDERGQPIKCATAEDHAVTADMRAAFMLSSKPRPNGYASEYEKVTAYVRILSHPAVALDESATPTPGAAWQEVEDDLPFRYRDTATARAGLAALNKVFYSQKIGVVGTGGTGGYVIDLVAKMPVADIALYDGDTFDNHNAFRAPGAAELEVLRTRPNKAEYFAQTYGHMHTGITAHPVFIDENNLTLLDDRTFVFLSMDNTPAKPIIIKHLRARMIPFIDVGMGVEEIDGKLSGLLRVTLNLPDSASADTQIPTRHDDAEEDDYSRNIQIADLNCLNAAFAVSRWKRWLGFYADGSEETSMTYSIYVNELSNEVD